MQSYGNYLLTTSEINEAQASNLTMYAAYAQQALDAVRNSSSS